jgi:hypothetical protein
MPDLDFVKGLVGMFGGKSDFDMVVFQRNLI